MDQLEKFIESRRAERAKSSAKVDDAKAIIAEAQKALDLALAEFRELDIEVKTLERASSLRPLTPLSISTAPPEISQPTLKVHKGRQPGSISYKWRAALADFVSAGNGPVDIETFYLVTRGRLGLSQASVRERVRNYVALGHLTEADGRICVADSAIAKYNLRDASAYKDTAPSDDESDEAADGSGAANSGESQPASVQGA